MNRDKQVRVNRQKQLMDLHTLSMFNTSMKKKTKEQQEERAAKMTNCVM